MRCVVSYVAFIYAFHMQMLWPHWVAISADTRMINVPGFYVFYVFGWVTLRWDIMAPGQ